MQEDTQEFLDGLFVIHTAAKSEEIGIIVLFCHASGIAIMNKCAANTFESIGGNRYANACTTAYYAQIVTAPKIFFYGQGCLIWIIDTIFGIDTEIDNLVPLAFEPAQEMEF